MLKKTVLILSVLFSLSLSAFAEMDLEQAQEKLINSCASCHSPTLASGMKSWLVPKWLETESDESLHRSLCQHQDIILERLSSNDEDGEPKSMPPKSSDFQLDMEERKSLIEFFSQEIEGCN